MRAIVLLLLATVSVAVGQPNITANTTSRITWLRNEIENCALRQEPKAHEALDILVASARNIGCDPGVDHGDPTQDYPKKVTYYSNLIENCALGDVSKPVPRDRRYLAVERVIDMLKKTTISLGCNHWEGPKEPWYDGWIRRCDAKSGECRWIPDTGEGGASSAELPPALSPAPAALRARATP